MSHFDETLRHLRNRTATQLEAFKSGRIRVFNVETADPLKSADCTASLQADLQHQLADLDRLIDARRSSIGAAGR
jgi:hypothetical protein